MLKKEDQLYKTERLSRLINLKMFRKFTTIASALTLAQSLTLSTEPTVDAEQIGSQNSNLPMLGQVAAQSMTASTSQAQTQVDSEAQTITLAEKKSQGVKRLVSQMTPRELKERIAAVVKHEKYDDEE